MEKLSSEQYYDMLDRLSDEVLMDASDSYDDELAKRAFAYLDEAQMIKEAAENDYITACAYEDAALDILDEIDCEDYDYDDYGHEVCASASQERIDRNYDYFTNNKYEQKLLDAQVNAVASRQRLAELNDAIRAAKSQHDNEEVSRLKRLRGNEKGAFNRAILEGLNPIHNARRAFGRMKINPKEAITGSISGGHDINIAYQKAYADALNRKLGE